jgi:hypothetical protein
MSIYSFSGAQPAVSAEELQPVLQSPHEFHPLIQVGDDYQQILV